MALDDKSEKTYDFWVCCRYRVAIVNLNSVANMC